jgi:hypothetical protein
MLTVRSETGPYRSPSTASGLLINVIWWQSRRSYSLENFLLQSGKSICRG